MKSDGPGYRHGWICPDCDKVSFNPAVLPDGRRHNLACQPMIACTVAWLHRFDATTLDVKQSTP